MILLKWPFSIQQALFDPCNFLWVLETAVFLENAFTSFLNQKQILFNSNRSACFEKSCSISKLVKFTPDGVPIVFLKHHLVWFFFCKLIPKILDYLRGYTYTISQRQLWGNYEEQFISHVCCHQVSTCGGHTVLSIEEHILFKRKIWEFISMQRL